MLKELAPANSFEAIWKEAGSEDGNRGSGDRVFPSISLLARADGGGAEKTRLILEGILETTKAERVFLFDIPPRAAGEPPVLGSCIASLNIDHESIRDPEGKIPADFLREVLRQGNALFSGRMESDPRFDPSDSLRSRACALGAVPLFAMGKAVGMVYFDHRFQPMDLDQEAAASLAILCHALGFLKHVEQLEAENRSLWQSVERIKEASRMQTVHELTVRTPSKPKVERSHLRGDYSLIVGSSPRMLEIFQLLDRISGSNAPILINGESGTGKELIANAVHKNSPRKDKPFISENCGALTETLLESELFGYVKGAFTGASKDHKGLFELADSGSLFLDEVGDMSPSMQKKLLRALQEGVIRRVGGKDFIHVNVRLICATNKDLLQECRQGRFREDLYYRLNVINIRMPALRERKEDIPELAEHFLAKLSEQFGSQKTIEHSTLQRMMQYSWPGNIRELENEVKRLYALSDGEIGSGDLSDVILQGDGRDFLHPGLEKELSELTLREATEKLEKEMIRWALISARGNKSLVAKQLQIPKTSLYNKINKYQLDKDLP